MFVADVVDANLAAATAAVRHDRFNVGTGVEVSVLDLLATIRRCGRADIHIFVPEFRGVRDGEIIRSCLDVSRARRELRLGPPTPLADGVLRTLDWLRTRPATPLPG